ncbi:MAG: hypothetical protein D6816_01230 [Bacteroidetes bacterium]|nr:MAG: hypothetical protein D6816_01230 [Bacteroidota bacterium]
MTTHKTKGSSEMSQNSFFKNRKRRFPPLIIGNGGLAERSQPLGCAALQIDDKDGGFLPPRLTTAERDAIQNPVEGLMVYNLDNKSLEVFDGVSNAWGSAGGGGGAGAVASVFGRTGAVVAANGDYNASQITNTPSGNLTSTTVQAALDELQTDIDNIPDEVISNAGPLSGPAPAGAQWGFDETNGQAYYVSGGNWQAMPVVTTDLNLTVSDQTGSTLGAAPVSPPATPDVGDVHLEVYDDFFAWWVWGGSSWSVSAQVATNPQLATVVSPAADDAVGAVGVSSNVAREDHKHPAQGISANSGNELTVGTDGLHFYQTKPHLFLDDTTVAPATAGLPTVAEFQAAIGANRSVFAYYTGTNVPTDTPTHIIHVDSAGDIKIFKEPAGATKYIHTFTAADWYPGPVYYTFMVLGTTHGIQNPSNVVVYEKNGTIYTPTGTDILVDPVSGNITINMSVETETPFDGIVHIS